MQRYATLSLADAYASVAHYLRHRGEVEAYLAEREALAATVKQQIEAVDDLSDIRARLQAHGGAAGQ